VTPRRVGREVPQDGRESDSREIDPRRPNSESQVRIAVGEASQTRRRPSGEPAPLPREAPAGVWIWVGVGVVIGLGLVTTRFLPSVAEAWGRGDDRVLTWGLEHPNPTLVTVAEAFDAAGSDWVRRVLHWTMLAVLLLYQRWRHLFAGLGAILAVEWLAVQVSLELDRLGGSGGGVLGSLDSPSGRSIAVAGLSVTLVVVGFALFPIGRWRTRWFIVTGIGVSLQAIGSVYLGVAQPTGVIVGGFLGAATAMTTFRLLVPDTAFPISYRRGRSAHLDVGGARNNAIRSALQDQLLDMSSARSAAVRAALMDQLGCGLVGCDIAELEPFGQAGSAGSTPLRMCVAGDPDIYVFGKLYAANHLRSDRWYKFGRVVMYGSLEDEAPFTSVRRLVEYEDYMLRVMRDAGIPTPRPYGFVEIAPSREYLLVTEFIGGASEIDQAQIDEVIIHQGLGLVRQLWDAGLAHRDIKPANLLIRGGKLILIDVAFATQRPSPWRQTVDLANMMLTLALRSDAGLVYELARTHFAPEDISEAFAATRGVTIPRQLRNLLKAHRGAGQDLIADFRDLAPQADPIKIQRWSLRRVLLIVGLIVVASSLVLLLGDDLRGADFFF
jgi:RIO1 family